jgi:hypothetical protein
VFDNVGVDHGIVLRERPIRKDSEMGKRSNDWHITGWKAFALLPVAVPVILFLKLFGIGQSKVRSPEEVAGFIRDFVEDSGGDWDWDDFISVTIKNPKLEEIRAEASMVELPLSPAGIDELKRLLAKAEELHRIPS